MMDIMLTFHIVVDMLKFSITVTKLVSLYRIRRNPGVPTGSSFKVRYKIFHTGSMDDIIS